MIRVEYLRITVTKDRNVKYLDKTLRRSHKINFIYLINLV